MEPVLRKRHFLEIEFNGSGYHGWQIQKNAMTVQEVLNNCIGLLLQTPVNCMGCGRTDARVHARRFFLHFDYDGEQSLGPLFVERLNKVTPRDIYVRKIYRLKEKGHARFSAIQRTYHYHITLEKDPFLVNLATFYYGELDVDAMNEAAHYILGEHDFTTFAKSGSGGANSTSDCIVYEAHWKRIRNRLVFKVTANRFLRRMVRMLVGTFVQVGTGKMKPEDIRSVMEKKDNQYSGMAVPPDGLYLTDVAYPEGMLKEITEEPQAQNQPKNV